MDSFIDEMSTVGELDSDGAFTVDLSRARLKLSEYQLTRFELYPDFLLSAGILAGARAISVVGKKTDRGVSRFATTIYFRGWSLTEEDVRSLDPVASDKSAKPALKNLAVALSTISSKHPILLKSKAKREVLSLIVKDEDLVATKSHDSKFPDNTTTLRIRFDLTTEIKERFHFHRLCTPIGLSLNKKPFRTGVHLMEDCQGALGYYTNGDVEGHLKQEADSPLSRLAEQDDALAYMLLLFENDGPVGLNFVVDGLAYPACRELSELGVAGIVLCPGLSRDLSFTGLVRDEAYKSAEEDTKKGVARLLTFLLESSIQPNPKEESSLRRLLSRLRNFLPREELGNRLDQLTANISPTLEPEAFELLCQKAVAGKVSQERISHAYEERVGELRVEGELQEAVAFQEHLLLLCQRVDSGHLRARRLLACLRLTAGFEPERSLEDPLLEFLGKIWDWSTNIFHNTKETPSTNIHPSWFIPMRLRTCLEKSDFQEAEDLLGEVEWPEWLEFLRRVSTNGAASAEGLVEKSQSLHFGSAKQAWYALLWTYRGQMSWGRAISLRAKLSREILSDDRGFSKAQRLLLPESGLGDLADKESRRGLLARGFFQPTFLPLLFATILLDQRRGRSSRVVWRGVIGQELCQLLLSGVDDPLSKPFLGSKQFVTADSASR